MQTDKLILASCDAGNYPAALVARAVATELWTPALALSIASDMGRDKNKAELYTSLLATGKLSGAEYADALACAREATGFIANDTERVRALATLADHLQGAPRVEALEEALRTLQNLNKGERLEALVALSPHLGDEQLAGAVKAALDVAAEDAECGHPEGGSLRARPSPAEGPAHADKAWTWERALYASLSSSSEGDAVEAFVILTRHVEGERLTHLTRQVDEFVRLALPHEDATVVACRATAVAILNGQMKDRATPAALAQEVDDGRVPERAEAQPSVGRQREAKWAQVSAVLAERLEGDARYRALLYGLTAALTVRCARERVVALSLYMPFLGDTARAWLLTHLIEVARLISSREATVEALALLIPHTQGRARAAVMAMGLDILQPLEKKEGIPAPSYSQEHSRGLAALAPYLEGEFLARGLKIAVTISKEMGCSFSSNVLAALAPSLEGALLKQALAACV